MPDPKKQDDFSRGYVPRFADIVHLNWAPSVGREMKGPHYGLVLSATDFNIATGLVIIIPITSKTGKLSSFEVAVESGTIRGCALIADVRSLDYQVRIVAFERVGPSASAIEANKRLKLLLPSD